MVPKKAKSKRLSCSKKYTIQKNVREHHRKLRKEARANPQLHKKKKKDPGIPNLFPLKEKMLQQIEQSKQNKQAEKDAAKLLSQQQKKQAKSEASRLLDMAQNAAQRNQEFMDSFEGGEGGAAADGIAHEEALTSGKRDDSRRAYYREFKKVVEAADVILQVLDVRDPLGCRSKQIEEMILNAGANKRIILILNKIDLVPREVVEQWLTYLRNEFPTIAFKASTQSQRQNLSQAKVSTKNATEGILKSSECLGADTLMKLLKNYCRNNHIKTSISVGVVGFPNVGKSSVINSLKRSRVCTVGSTPGVTKSTQEIHLDKHIKLIDSPGIVFSKAKSPAEAAEAILRNCVKVELVEDPISPVEVILGRMKKEQLMILYNIPFFNTTTEFLIHIARQKGRIRKGGVPDLENAARAILSDWNAGRIPFFTTPPASGPAVDTHVSASLVEGWSKEFEMGELIAVEGKDVLPGVKSKCEISSKFLSMKSSSINAMELQDDDDEEEVEEDDSEMEDVEEVEDESEMDED